MRFVEGKRDRRASVQGDAPLWILPLVCKRCPSAFVVRQVCNRAVPKAKGDDIINNIVHIQGREDRYDTEMGNR